MKQISEEDCIRCRTECLHRGNTTSLSLEIGRYPVANANPRHNQRGESDKCEELTQSLDKTPCARCPVRAVTHFPSAAGKLLDQCFTCLGGIARAGFDPVFHCVKTARLNQLGRRYPGLINQGNRPKSEAFAHPVRFFGDDTDHTELSLANADFIANLEAESFGKSWRNRHIIASGARGQSPFFKRQFAEERIGRVHAL